MSRIYDLIYKMKTDNRTGVLTVMQSKGDKVYLTFNQGKVIAAIWQTKDDRAIPLWFYLQTNSKLISDEEYQELEDQAKQKEISVGELLSNIGNLPVEKRTKYITGKLEEIIFNLFSLKDDELVGTTFNEKEILYPHADVEISLDVSELWEKYVHAIKDLELVVDFFGDKQTELKVIAIPEEGLSREERFILNFISNRKSLYQVLALPLPNKLRIYQILADLKSKNVIEIIKEKSHSVSQRINFNPVKAFILIIILFVLANLLPTLGNLINRFTEPDITMVSPDRTDEVSHISELVRAGILNNGDLWKPPSSYSDRYEINITDYKFTIEP